MKISVVMLTYNREEYIKEAIQSVQKQTLSDFEFIIVDNGSSDRSGEIAGQYAKSDERIRVLSIPKSNIGTGRNVGIDTAQGDYITFIDDDDWMDDDMLEFLYRLSVKYDADISFCGSAEITGEQQKPRCKFDDCRVMTPETAVMELVNRKSVRTPMTTKLIRKELMKSIRFPEKGKFDDITTTYKYLAKANKIVGHGIVKYYARRHASNNSAFTGDYRLFQAEELDEYLLAFHERAVYIRENLPSIRDFGDYSEYSYMLSMCNKIKTYGLTDCKRQREEMVRQIKENVENIKRLPYLLDFEKEWLEEILSEH